MAKKVKLKDLEHDTVLTPINAESVKGGAGRNTGAQTLDHVGAYNFKVEIEGVTQGQNVALINSVSFPGLDGSSKEPAY